MDDLPVFEGAEDMHRAWRDGLMPDPTLAVPAFDLALGLRMEGRATDMLDAAFLEPFRWSGLNLAMLPNVLATAVAIAWLRIGSG